MSDLQEILKQYGVSAPALPFGNGHINNTYLVNSTPRLTLQRINTNVFRKPEEVMENIEAVTSFLREKIERMGEDPSRRTLRVVRTLDGSLFYRTPEGDAYRMYEYVEDTVTPEEAPSPTAFAESARAFGAFQNLLSDFPAERLHETIPHFHDTPDRYRQFREALSEDRAHRAGTVQEEIDFVLSHEKYASVITDAIADGTVPLRVTHNDTKLNNVLLDKTTLKGICVIDLDTVMPGSLLYDFGDALRFGASTAAEDEQDLSRVHFDPEKFEIFTAAFLGEVGGRLTPRERELLPMSVLLMTLECGSRFLADHLNGDVYFRIHRENQNLDRARTQFRLVAEIEQCLPQLAEIVAKY